MKKKKQPDKKLQNSSYVKQQRLEEYLKVREVKRSGWSHGEARS